MILVYIAGPFSAPTREGVEANILAANRLGVEVARRGYMPVIPHANTGFPEMESVQPYSFWIEGTLALMRACDCVLLLPNWLDSSGARGEVEEALRCSMPVFTGLRQLDAWAEEQDD